MKLNQIMDIISKILCWSAKIFPPDFPTFTLIILGRGGILQFSKMKSVSFKTHDPRSQFLLIVQLLNIKKKTKSSSLKTLFNSLYMVLMDLDSYQLSYLKVNNFKNLTKVGAFYSVLKNPVLIYCKDASKPIHLHCKCLIISWTSKKYSTYRYWKYFGGFKKKQINGKYVYWIFWLRK